MVEEAELQDIWVDLLVQLQLVRAQSSVLLIFNNEFYYFSFI